MDRQQLLKRLDTAWTDFNSAYAGLSDSRLTEPGVTGASSVRCILAHITTWEEEALAHLPRIVDCGRPPRFSTTYGGIDAFNARMMRRGETCRSPRYCGTSMTSICASTRTAHYAKNARVIRAWRERWQ
jgi:hypothetical protein